jgi:hypothetical protein
MGSINVVNRSKSYRQSEMVEFAVVRSRTVDLDEARFFSEWGVLARALDSILVSNESGSLASAHHALERLCQNDKFLPQVYSALLQKIDKSYAEMLQRLGSEFSLDQLVSSLSFISSGAKIMSSLFAMMQPKYFVDESLEDLMLRRLKAAILGDPRIIELLSRDIASAISQFRENYILMPALSDAISVAISFGLEKPVYDAIEDHSAVHFSGRIPEDLGAAKTIVEVQTTLKRELEIAKILPRELGERLLYLTRKHVYVGLFHRNMQNFVDELFDERHINYHGISQLANLITTSENDDLDDEFIEAVSKFSIRSCERNLSQSSLSCVRDFVQLLGEFRDIVSIYHVSQVEYAIKYLREILNVNCHRMIQFVNRYIHQQMLKHDDIFVSRISDVVSLVELLEDESYFYICFRQFLAIRLVASFSLSAAILPGVNRDELQLLFGVRQLFNNTRFEALNGMIQDMRNFSAAFSGFRSSQSLNFKAMFLSIEQWPSFPTFGLIVMPPIAEARSQFEQFCKRVHSQKVIRWIDSLESCVFLYQELTVVASSLQTVVFHCIVNDRPLSETGLSDDTQQEVLLSLVRAGLLIKRKESFRLVQFSATRRMIRINSYTYCFPDKLAEFSREELFRRRRPVLESTIARLLKSRGGLAISELFRECANAYKFTLNNVEFRECLKMLIAKAVIFKAYDGTYRSCPVA